ncbi:FCD domain-containing protein [Rhizobium sp. SG741]|uniref:GntR family transcriptional regulator n=1 Tax=Rhizobium sp. SG741 TaxID=2587114 RepID=UPI001447A7B9|nr:FCD domain-containing protein [Rhizobium sp. SG741]NKJ08394.1 DNA-binding GntR family transcriptional regulator [Rhizobium sp. SG741]
MNEVIESTTQADQVHSQLRSAILSGALAPGERIRMNFIASDKSVSLGAVREALSRLAAEEIVIATAQRGYRVASLSAEELNDLTETRIALEQICLRASIAEGSVEWEASLAAALHRLLRMPEFENGDCLQLSMAWSQAHDSFHTALVSGARSVWMNKFRSSLYRQAERYRRLSVPLRTGDRDVAGEHRQLCEAALARDAESACALMRTHLMRTSEILLRSPLLMNAERLEATGA